MNSTPRISVREGILRLAIALAFVAVLVLPQSSWAKPPLGTEPKEPAPTERECKDASNDCDICVGEKLVEGGVCAGTSSLVVTPIGAAVGCTAIFFGRVIFFCKTNSDCKKAKECRDRGIIRISSIQAGKGGRIPPPSGPRRPGLERPGDEKPGLETPRTKKP
jgi:hypothetical protein